MISITEASRPRSHRSLLAPLAALAQCSAELSASSVGGFSSAGSEYQSLLTYAPNL
jgi:hypothetical protein